MNEVNPDIKKSWMQFRLKREEWKNEEEIIHKWSMLALKIGTIALGIIGISKLVF